MKMKSKPSKAGFTLIELVIAIIIISLAIAPLAVTLGNMMNATVMPEVLNVGTMLAEQELEKIYHQRYASIVATGPTNYSGDFASYSYEIEVAAVPGTIATDPGMANYKQVTVIVRHDVIGSVELTTLVTNNP